ncbi:WGxxGxxG family protein [Paenibacillus sp. CAU 1782]
MKKAGLLAIIMTCFTFAIALPAASAHNGVDALTANVSQMDNAANYNRTSTDGNMMNRAENNLNRGMNRMENGMNRAMNNVENGVNRTFGTDGYAGTNRVNTMNNGRYRTNAATTTTATTNRNFNWGWLGLLGLIGLAGMRSRDRDRA